MKGEGEREREREREREGGREIMPFSFRCVSHAGPQIESATQLGDLGETVKDASEVVSLVGGEIGPVQPTIGHEGSRVVPKHSL